MPVLRNAVINNACRMYRNFKDRAAKEREHEKKKESTEIALKCIENRNSKGDK
jgi:hypothetical protein